MRRWMRRAGDGLADAGAAYRLRWKRRRLLWRALRKRRQLRPVCDRTAGIAPDALLAFCTLRNERARLPYFIDYHRELGIGHFLIVDNDSDDGSRDWLAAQPDVSLWHTGHSYKLSRFGMDWLTWLQMRHGHGYWCLTLDADEILVYPYCATRPLGELTRWLDRCELPSFGALMLDMYPKGPVGEAICAEGRDPTEVLQWFDSGNYTMRVQQPMQNLWVQGGVRARMFFAAQPRRAPTLNKIPLVKWNRRFVYVNSTHALLPRRLNRVYETGGGERVSGVLLHTKFLGTIVEKSREERERREHFANSALYDSYYAALTGNPDLWCERSRRYLGWRQLEALGLMSRGLWQ